MKIQHINYNRDVKNIIIFGTVEQPNLQASNIGNINSKPINGIRIYENTSRNVDHARILT